MSVVRDIAMGLISPITGLISEFIVDKDEAARLAHDIATLAAKQAHEQTIAQIEVNKVEAAHKSLFVAGWRPAIGWICGFGLAYGVIISPVLDIWFDVPSVEAELLYPVLMGMLGLGGLRSFEKSKGVAREH